MLVTKTFGEELKKLGFHFYSGVPCSYLKNLINYAINDCDYVAATNEGEAIAIASGAQIGRRKAVVLMQNSGLTNAISPLVSLNNPFQIPLLGFVSLRGDPDIPDEPQHELMGQISTRLLDLMQIKWAYLSDGMEVAKHQLIKANQWINQNKSFFFVVRKGVFANEILDKNEVPTQYNNLKKDKSKSDQYPTRYNSLTAIHALKDNQTILIATTGKTGRELYEIKDASNHFYMVGSMGCVSSFGLGLALSQPKMKIVVIDGDGSLLMRMGSLATNGTYHPPNMLHILLDNHVHDSTGGQNTVSPNINFVNIASNCGYKKSMYIHNLTELQTNIKKWNKTPELTFLYLKISKGSQAQLARPKMKPHEVKTRLQLFVDQAISTEGATE